jgi:hypothetical protein
LHLHADMQSAVEWRPVTMWLPALTLQLRAPGRALQQSTTPPADGIAAPNSTDVASVDTPEALLAALEEGVAHVVVIDHLDFASLPPVDSNTSSSIRYALLRANSTKSIRVCSQTLLCSFSPAMHCVKVTRFCARTECRCITTWNLVLVTIVSEFGK